MKTHTTKTKPIEILLVEDNPADARLTIEGFKEHEFANRIFHVPDGVEAINYLQRQGPYTHVHRPDLILLDLNLPRMDGRKVLAQIKNDANLRRIPVVVLTSSKAEEDVFVSYDLHANCYVAKPVDLDQFLEVIQSIEHFWCTVVSRPME